MILKNENSIDQTIDYYNSKEKKLSSNESSFLKFKEFSNKLIRSY